MKNLILKIITVALGILILCVVLKLAFNIDLWNGYILPAIQYVWNWIKSLFN